MVSYIKLSPFFRSFSILTPSNVTGFYVSLVAVLPENCLLVLLMKILAHGLGYLIFITSKLAYNEATNSGGRGGISFFLFCSQLFSLPSREVYGSRSIGPAFIFLKTEDETEKRKRGEK